jgi:hypothetical protein
VRTPLPKAAAARRNHRPPAMPQVRVPALGAGSLAWGEPDSAWAPVAQDVFRALGQSQQASLAQPSDIAVARFACLSMSRSLQMTKFSPTAFSAIVEALNDLGATLGSRLRLRLDLDQAPSAAEGAAEVARLRVLFGGARDGGA